MKRSVCSFQVLFVFCLLMCAANAHAFGVGPYIEYDAGSGSFSEDEDRLAMDGDAADMEVNGFGIMMDTNLSTPMFFNYRLSMGYNSMDLPSGNDGWRVSMDHEFGFGMLQTEGLRVWFGPQLHLSYGRWEVARFNDAGGYEEYASYLDEYYGDTTDDVKVFGVGVGAVLGANLNLPSVGSFCSELGVRYQTNVTSDATTYTDEDGLGWGYSYQDPNEMDYSYDETVVFFKISFLFGK